MLERWNPYRRMRRMEDMVDRLWRNAGWPEDEDTDLEGWVVPLDVSREQDRITVKASVPGVSRDNLRVTIEDNVLMIRGETSEDNEERQDSFLLRERHRGSFFRSVRLPDNVDPDKAESSLSDGVLTVTAPLKEEARPRQIDVNPT
ncbi:MAG: Hsp20/alpha crystallin family protein [Chloroflexota bacterium]